jgi:hypothetical protein
VATPIIDENLGKQKTVSLGRLKQLPHKKAAFGEIAAEVKKLFVH